MYLSVFPNLMKYELNLNGGDDQQQWQTSTYRTKSQLFKRQKMSNYSNGNDAMLECVNRQGRHDKTDIAILMATAVGKNEARIMICTVRF